MASLNKVLLMGNLTRDPELRYTPQGTAVATLRLAVNRKYKGRDEQMKEEVCFISCIVWSKMAETCGQYLHKGSPVFVEGRLQSRSWEDQATGKQRSVIEVNAERVQFLGGPGGRGGSGQQSEEAPAAEGTTENAWTDENEEKINETQ